MAADMYIHVVNEECTEGVLASFFSNTFGSKYFDPRTIGKRSGWEDSYDIVARTPQVYVGEVSWLKGGLTGDADTFIPDYIEGVREILHDMPIIDNKIIEAISRVCTHPNDSIYSTGSNFEDIHKFLEEHRGKQCFTVSW